MIGLISHHPWSAWCDWTGCKILLLFPQDTSLHHVWRQIWEWASSLCNEHTVSGWLQKLTWSEKQGGTYEILFRYSMRQTSFFVPLSVVWQRRIEKCPHYACIVCAYNINHAIKDIVYMSKTYQHCDQYLSVSGVYLLLWSALHVRVFHHSFETCG